MRYLLFVSFFLGSCNSCKNISQPIYPSVTFLSNYQWHLISVTNSNLTTARYKGSSGDSMRFTWKWANNGDVLLDSIFYYVNGNVNKYAGNFLFGIPSANTYIDTVSCFPIWKLGYSNALVIRSIENNFLIFTVSKIGSTEMEIDSLQHY
jgi:hypothetical protein